MKAGTSWSRWARACGWMWMLGALMSGCAHSSGGAHPQDGTESATVADGPADDPSAIRDQGKSCELRPACDAALPDFGPKRSFKNWSSKLTASAGGPNHRGRDLFLREGQPALALGKFAYGVFDDDIKGEEVDLYLLRGCAGEWIRVGTFLTSHDNEHETVYGVEDTGGRLFVDLEQAGMPPLEAGRHKLLMVVGADLTYTEAYLEVLPENAQIAVSDVDGTLTSSEYSAVTQVIGLEMPEAHPGAAEVMTELAQRGYYIFYLTARPEWMGRHSRQWLELRGFPPGILHTTLKFQGANGESAREYKTAELTLLAQMTGLVPAYGFGNKPSDVATYQDSGLVPERSYYYKLQGDPQGGVNHDDYRTLIPMAKAAPSVCP